MCACQNCAAMPPHPLYAGKHLNPATRTLPIHEWGSECRRGFVSDSRFARGTETVIKRTDRNKTRQVYRGPR